MSFPIRCFTCGKVIGKYELVYFERKEQGEEPKEILDSLKIDRICCRRMFISYVDLTSKLLQYPRVNSDTQKSKIKENT